MKILYFTKYDTKGASSRMRSMQYFPYLKDNGVKIDYSPLFSNSYLESLYQGKRSIRSVLFGYFNRFFKLFTVFRYDKIVIEYELFPFLPAWTEKLLKGLGVKYIVDYDDAIFHNYDLHANKWVRRFLADKIDKVMKNSWVVVAGNKYLGERAITAGARKVEIIPTVINLEKYKYTDNIDDSNIFVVGWLGSPSTYKYVEEIWEELKKLSTNYNVVFHIIGAKHIGEVKDNIHFIPWSDESEVSLIRQFDVGIMPLDDTPWSRGKCGFKLIQYMASAVPVVASAVGANIDIVESSQSGLLVHNKEGWLDALEIYVQQPRLRKVDGTNGRKAVEERYALQNTASRVFEILKS